MSEAVMALAVLFCVHRLGRMVRKLFSERCSPEWNSLQIVVAQFEIVYFLRVCVMIVMICSHLAPN